MFGRMDEDFTKVVIGFVALGVAQCLLLPLAMKAMMPTPVSRRRLFQCLLLVAAVITLLAACALGLMGWFTQKAFSWMAASGAADPETLGGMLPIRPSHFFTVCLVLAQCLMVTVACAGAWKGRHWARSLPCLIPFVCLVLVMLWIKLSPVDSMSRILSDIANASPVELARHISLMLKAYYVGAACLGASALGLFLSVLIKGKSKAQADPQA